ncbi:conserved hypothetical protein [Methanocella paludicola SANAE]|uniref:Glutamine amidotransferase domain-containing protein n=1 Tax=Methanocella paludicola (strain DSM 17711 / JCM 13418 / NBRC 101707 / SANAE) TaxID=304371 RepID=D1YYH5_METPS|nr:hypothetical protein [Methanocella paludicola]BAI61497.1 conserved hypothetical protein [Methanocella paludicola SANAE]
MTDASFISDRGNVFEAAFNEFGYTCQKIVPQAFGSPFCQPSKLLIVPSGFADPKYYKVLPALKRNKEKIAEFIKNGGIVLAFGAMLDDYEYDWLPMKLKYNMQFKTRNVRLIKPDSPAALLLEPGEKDCDGYFTEHDGETIMTLDDGRPVLVHKQYGKGHIIAASLHEYPSKKFIDWACSKERESLTI